ncbi:MAG: nitronate monooxygenase [Acidobacteriota bacterium]
MATNPDSRSVASRVAALKARLAVPVIAAPMFLVSGPELVVAACKAGVVGSFPTLNARPLEELERWLVRIAGELDAFEAAGGRPAPWAANLIVHRSNPRAEDDLKMVLQFKPEIVITALGTPAAAVHAVHAYGGLVFADVNSVFYAKKAAQAGVDGLVVVATGAGGHAGAVTPFAFVPAVRDFFSGPIVLGGGIVSGRGVRAAEVLGADFAYLGTRFIAAQESRATDAYKQMVVDSTEEDVMLSAHFTGVPANYLKPSIVNAGLDPETLSVGSEKPFDHRNSLGGEAKAWRDIWSAGQGVRATTRVQSVADIVAELKADYLAGRNAS